MKKFLSYAFVGAIALAGATVVSCSSDDSDGPVNPTFNGETVKTQFNISLNGSAVGTRQSAATVQLDQTIASFRGMQDIVLIPYMSATDRTSRAGTNISLTKMIAPTTATVENAIPAGTLVANNNSVLYNDVTIPIGTSGFLFYGKAVGTDGFADGYLNTNVKTAAESADIYFENVQIASSPNTTVGVALASYLSAIAAAANGEAAWHKCADASNASQPWYSVGLGELYSKFITVKAASSANIKAMVQDLYTSLKDNADVISVAICNAIKTKATADASGKLTFDTSLDGYPADNNLPDGAAAVSWSNASPAVATAVTTGASDLNIAAMDKFVYPASLYYYANSGVKTSNETRQADYVPANNTWQAILDKYTDGTSVSSSTLSVAINDQIQYAVGRLDTKVNKLSETTYYDRQGKVVAIPAAGFTFTGVLIGGQNKVGYNFAPTVNNQNYVIYDNTINTTSASNVLTASADAGTNYTLALQTAPSEKVKVAVEFVNTLEVPFMGIDGIIEPGCKFYLVAELDPASAAAGSGDTGNRVFFQDYKTLVNFTIKPGKGDVDNDGISDQPEGFANAYNVVPDLRNPKLELGLSVNLEWRAGLTFNVEL